MRIIFEDCLGYIRHDRMPFQGLATRQASPEAVKELRSPLLSRRGTVELLSARYVASWGVDSDRRFCMVQTIRDGDGPPAPRLLGVRPEGFIARVTGRAVKEKIPERYTGEEFSPLTVTGWHEPETGHDSGPERGVSFTIMPTDHNEDDSILEAGLLVMSGPLLPDIGEGAR
ncbi:hypothetical protein [Aurantimonas endophytica]|nr:hypothetical protein [Aurantimonas endophytica]